METSFESIESIIKKHENNINKVKRLFPEYLSADDPCPECGKLKSKDGWCDCWQGQNLYIDKLI